MTDTLALDESDARAIVRLLGEVASAPGAHAEKKRLVMDGLSRLIDADSWWWGLAVQPDCAKTPCYVCIDQNGFSPAQFASFHQASDHPEMTGIQSRFASECARRSTHLTRHRRQLDPDDSYQRTAAFPLWQAANVNGVIISFRPMGGASFSVVGLYRRLGAPLFSERDNRIAHIILTSIPWLHAQSWPEDRGVDVPKLSPRQRITMNLLIQGFTRAQIAEHLKISVHTANEYVKTVFKHFGVHSQAALIGWFKHGDGGTVR